MRAASAVGWSGIALAFVLSLSCSDGGGGGSGSTDFVGTMVGANESAALTLTISTKVTVPAAQADVLGASSGVGVSGQVQPAGGSPVALSGSYTNGGFTAAGGGYSLTGQVVSGGISGSFTGPNGPGSFALIPGAASGATVFCGSISSQVTGQHGTFNLVIRGSSVSGLAMGGGGVLPISGTVSGSTISISGSLAGVTISATGTVSGTTVSGTYTATGAATDNGSWSGGPCGGGGGTTQSCNSVGGTGEPATITQTTQWVSSPHHLTQTVRVQNGAILIIHPGVVVCADPGAALIIGEDGSEANLNASATPANPIRFEATNPAQGWQGIVIDANTSSTLLLANLVDVRITDAVRAVEAHRWTLVKDAWISGYRDIGIEFDSMASLVNVTVTGYAGSAGGGTGVRIGPNTGVSGANLRLLKVDHSGHYGVRLLGGLLHLSDCDISAVSGDGVTIEAASSTFTAVTGCNIAGNDGVGISSATASNIFAQNNWWGDPAGPSGPAGDGVSGMVDASHPAATPFTLGPFPSLRR